MPDLLDRLRSIESERDANWGLDDASVPEDVDLHEDDVLASFDLGAALNLNAIAIGLGLEAVTYEPESFPGLCYDAEEGATAILFGEGDCVAIADSREDAERVRRTVENRLDDLGLLE